MIYEKELDIESHPLLRLTVPSVDTSDDAMSLLRQAASSYVEYTNFGPVSDLEVAFSEQTHDAGIDDRVSEWITANHAVQQLVTEMVARGDVHFPTDRETDASDDAFMSTLIDAYLVMKFEAKRRHASKDLAGSADAYVSIMSFVRMLQEGGIPPSGYIAILGSQEDALDGMRALGREAGIDTLHLEAMIASVTQSEDSRGVCAQMIRIQYHTSIRRRLLSIQGEDVPSLIGYMSPSKYSTEEYASRNEQRRALLVDLLGNHPRPFDRADTLRRVSYEYVRALVELQLPSSETERAVQADDEIEILSAWPAALRVTSAPLLQLPNIDKAAVRSASKVLQKTENPFGKRLSQEVRGKLKQFVLEANVSDAICGGTAIVLAIRGFELQYMRPPRDLVSLVPGGWLTEMPLDPFTNSLFRYQSEDGIVSSAGPDQKVSGDSVRHRLRWSIRDRE